MDIDSCCISNKAISNRAPGRKINSLIYCLLSLILGIITREKCLELQITLKYTCRNNVFLRYVKGDKSESGKCKLPLKFFVSFHISVYNEPVRICAVGMPVYLSIKIVDEKRGMRILWPSIPNPLQYWIIRTSQCDVMKNRPRTDDARKGFGNINSTVDGFIDAFISRKSSMKDTLSLPGSRIFPSSAVTLLSN